MTKVLGYDVTYGPILHLKQRFPSSAGEKYTNRYPPLSFNFLGKDEHWYFGQIVAWNPGHHVGYVITNNEDAVTTVQEAIILGNDPKLKHQSKIKHLLGMHGVTLKLSQEHIFFPTRADNTQQTVKIDTGVLVRFKVARNCITQVFHAVNAHVFSFTPILSQYPIGDIIGGIQTHHVQRCVWVPKKKLKVLLKRQQSKELWDE